MANCRMDRAGEARAVLIEAAMILQVLAVLRDNLTFRSFGQLANYITRRTTANGQLHWEPSAGEVGMMKRK